MRHNRWLVVALALAAVGASKPATKLGADLAYRTLGGLPVMHAGRIKPWDTVAREEVKQIYGRESIKLVDAEGNPSETWAPSAALLDWSARPDFWNDRSFILVEYLPLKRLILKADLEARLAAIEAAAETPAAAKAEARSLAKDESPTASALRALAGHEGLADRDRAGLRELAVLLSEEHKWLSPRILEEAKVQVEGRSIPLVEWMEAISDKKRGGPAGAEVKLDEVETKALDAGMRLMHYRAIRDRDFRSVEPLRAIPRPSSPAYLKYAAATIESLREGKVTPQTLPPLAFDAAKELDTYWKDLPREDKKIPGEDPKFDARFSSWLRDRSVWVPLALLIDAEPDEVERAGFSAAKVTALRDTYRAMEQAEQSSPGAIGLAPVAAFVAAVRDLGQSLSPENYPTSAAIEREISFNETAPFYKAPIAYGAALLCLILSLSVSADRRSAVGRMGRGLYHLGMASFVGGIALEVFGFYSRVRITGWAPVTNMYETVIWVALMTAVIGLVLELIYRKTYAATAASGVALFATLLAANVPLLDPDIKLLMPVLRSNYWLVVHVTTIVSSYAAFALAMGLGLIATGYYLTATYRHRPSLLSTMLPLLPGLPLLGLGLAGVSASYGTFGPSYVSDGTTFYVLAITSVIGGILTGAGLIAPIGELINRVTFRESVPIREAVEAMAPAVNPVVAALRAKAGTDEPTLDPRALAMKATAAKIKPLSNFIYRAMQVGVLLVAAGTILGGVWADYSWGRFWGWDAKEVWALITLLVYLVPLHGRFAGWVNTFGLVTASVACFLSVLMAWYGVNFVLGVGLHSYGFTEGGGQGVVVAFSTAVLGISAGTAWRRSVASKAPTAPASA